MHTCIILKSIALTTALIATAVMAVAQSNVKAVAQSDTDRICALLSKGGDYMNREINQKIKNLDSSRIFFDQALALGKSIHNDEWINLALDWKGCSFLAEDDLPRGKACFMQIVGYHHRIGDQRGEAEAWNRFGQVTGYTRSDLCAEKVKSFEQARQLYHLIGDRKRELDCYKDEADANLWVPNLDLAEKEFLEIAQGYKAIHAGGLHYTYDLLRAIYKLRGDLVKEVQSVTEMVQSLDSSDSKHDSIGFSGLYGRASQTYARAQMWDRSLFYSKKGADLAVSYPYYYLSCVQSVVAALLHYDSARVALNFLSAAIRRQPPVRDDDHASNSLAMGNCYLALKDFKKAEEEYLKVKRFLDTSGNKREDAGYRQSLLEMKLAIGNFYLHTHRYEIADAYSKKLHFDKSDLVSLAVRVSIEKYQSQVDSVMGRYKESLIHFAAFHRLNDSLAGIQKAIQLQELQVKYAIGQKDKDLRIQASDIHLLTKQNQLQQTEAASSRTFRNMMTVGIFILLLLIAVIYSRYRMKQRKNLELEYQQKEIFEKNRQLERLLTENEWLLREVHHRVKNNLQVIISLLKSQSSFLHDKAALAAVVESEHRVYAMSLLHQKLYKSNNVTSIDMPEYIGDLVEYLKYAFQGSGKFWFDLQVEPIKLDLQQAVPVGLILNEIITNSFKYAFPYTDEDRISVRLSATEDGWLSLIIADNGRGLPKDFDLVQNQSFGMLLIAGLTEDLEGSLHIESQQGTLFHIRFKPASIKPASANARPEEPYFNK